MKREKMRKGEAICRVLRLIKRSLKPVLYVFEEEGQSGSYDCDGRQAVRRTEGLGFGIPCTRFRRSRLNIQYHIRDKS